MDGRGPLFYRRCILPQMRSTTDSQKLMVACAGKEVDSQDILTCSRGLRQRSSRAWREVLTALVVARCAPLRRPTHPASRRGRHALPVTTSLRPARPAGRSSGSNVHTMHNPEVASRVCSITQHSLHLLLCYVHGCATYLTPHSRCSLLGAGQPRCMGKDDTCCRFITPSFT